MKLFTDEQIKASYTQAQLVDLVRRKAAIGNGSDIIESNPSYNRYNKDTLIMMVRDLDKLMEYGTN